MPVPARALATAASSIAGAWSAVHLAGSMRMSRFSRTGMVVVVLASVAMWVVPSWSGGAGRLPRTRYNK